MNNIDGKHEYNKIRHQKYYQKHKKQINIKQMVYHRKNKIRDNQRQNKNRTARIEGLRVSINEEKIRHGGRCILCGYNHDLRALIWHHTDPLNKRSNISSMIHQGLSLLAIKTEITKCQLICANCHTILEREY